MSELNYAGMIDASTVDYRDKVCAVVYLCGCPYRCPWCQNPDLVFNRGPCKPFGTEGIVEALKENFLVQAVCVTGGEPAAQEGTLELLKRIKSGTDLLLKLDTNGCAPDRLFLALQYLDFVSMDFKAPLDERYGKAVGFPEKWEEAVSNTLKTLGVLKGSGIETEARTTVIPGIVDDAAAIGQIAKVVGEHGFKYYTLQQFRPRNTLDPEYEGLESPVLETMRELGRAAKKTLPKTTVSIVTQKNGLEEMLNP
ncbi:MAG: anaerobic ribonucleoside-triphosphate reductase activating protein [Candidatus Altiarchaeota archaeon]|nr:anaerobic ribonucleoside-triphosphate reductase activating protein [Candidatus Altiarchaeota archaeon]